MALVANGYNLIINMIDSGENTFSKTIELASATVADAVTDAATFLASWLTVSGLEVTGYSIVIRFIEDAVLLPAGIEGENRARITVRLADRGNLKATFEIPGALAGIFVDTIGSNRNVVDLTAGEAVPLLMAHFQTGGFALLSDGEVAGDVVAGRRVHVKNLNG